MLCFRKLPVAKKFMDKRAGEKSRFSVENFLSQSAEIFRGGTLLCVINFGYRKSLDERVGGGEVSRFSVESFCLTVTKNFVGQILSVSLVSGFEKF